MNASNPFLQSNMIIWFYLAPKNTNRFHINQLEHTKEQIIFLSCLQNKETKTIIDKMWKPFKSSKVVFQTTVRI